MMGFMWFFVAAKAKLLVRGEGLVEPAAGTSTFVQGDDEDDKDCVHLADGGLDKTLEKNKTQEV